LDLAAGVGGAALLSQEFSAANKRFPDFAFFGSVELRQFFKGLSDTTRPPSITASGPVARPNAAAAPSEPHGNAEDDEIRVPVKHPG
jgi:hypothetical protein